MDEERFISARENPRNLAGFSNGARVMPGEASAAQKPMPTILDRFKAVLRDREDDMRVSMAGDDQDVPPPTSEEVVRLYEQMLSELTFNSKPIITDLTIIAGDQREHGEGIAEAICARILEVFCEAYRQVQPNLYPAMRHLFGTWSTVFPASVLHKIEAQLQFSPSANRQSPSLTTLRASESPRPTHGIHVNPKYLEARHQFEHSTADSNNQPARGTSSTSKNNRQKPASGYDEYDSENVEVISSQVGTPGLSSTAHATRSSFALGAEKLPLPSASRLLNSSPFRIEHGRSLSPPVDIAVDNSPRRVIERASPSRLGFEYGHGRMTGREDQSSHWPGKRWSDGSYKLVETSPLYPNGIELQRPRALIDAYGSDERNQTSSKPLKVDMNGMDNKFNIKTWQNTEEEEFDWEDMTPNVANRRQNNDVPSSSGPPSFRTRPGYGTNIADADFRRSNHLTQARISIHKDSSVIPEDSDPTLSSGRGSSSNITGLHENTTKILSSHYPQGRLNFLGQPSHHPLNAVRNARNFQMLGSSGAEQRPLLSSYPDVDAHPHGSSSNVSRIGAAGLDTWKSEALSGTAPPSTGVWTAVNVQKLRPFPVPHLLPPQKQTQNKFESMNANQALNKSILPEHQFSNIRNKTVSSIKPLLFPNQQSGSILLNPQNAGQVSSVQQQLLLTQEARKNLVPPTAIPTAVSVPSPAQTLTHGYTSQGHYTAVTSVLSNPIPGVHPPMSMLNAPGGSIHLQGGGLPPLPPGPRPPSQMIPISHNPVPIASNPQAGGAITGLISSLMAQGLISLTKETPLEDSVGLEFNLDVLKVRHESAITALYTGLPRQCTTCGLRFKSQEEHSIHMDWHVTKNRISKNRKQKPSRKWFVSVSMWLTGAEALGTDAVPGFLPDESIVEKKDDEEFSVPADEDQNVCALCGEPFDDFYSDETEEWMYKGAVYMNAPGGSTAGMDRSQLGPIVHAKCRSESSAVSPEGFGQDEKGYTEEGSQRKRLRT
ncbi:polyadenylation and cleavage factor homolog 4 isoform X2 [Diospyros lotus]|uniref:polyadenylation and cleavage factor homolog 4 isoform X2 n=1 Tax=Diospyros lotus TaxID=55363 RepID=UPI002253C714|nr:polyadenylation and cleavage factor homolog 4 isoform X2 [Diospyros lotus]